MRPIAADVIECVLIVVYNCVVRLGNSGLKVSKLILGTMQYGHKNWADWVIDNEDEATEHIKYACAPSS